MVHGENKREDLIFEDYLVYISEGTHLTEPPVPGQ